jgi:hypothetical protein
MKTIDEIIDIMHSPESSDSAVLWAGSKFDALSKEEVQNLFLRGKISLEELENHPTHVQSKDDLKRAISAQKLLAGIENDIKAAYKSKVGDICPKSCHYCADELVVLKVWNEWNYYLCKSCKAVYDYKGNKLCEEDAKQILSQL